MSGRKSKRRHTTRPAVLNVLQPKRHRNQTYDPYVIPVLLATNHISPPKQLKRHSSAAEPLTTMLSGQSKQKKKRQVDVLVPLATMLPGTSNEQVCQTQDSQADHIVNLVNKK